MKSDLKGLQIFEVGLIISIVTNFLGVLDLGKVFSFIISVISVCVFMIMLTGAERLTEYDMGFIKTRNLLIAGVLLSSVIALLMGMAMADIEYWMTVTAVLFVISRAAVYIAVVGMAISGCVGISQRKKVRKSTKRLELENEYKEKCNRTWKVYLWLSVISIAIDVTGVMLINQDQFIWIALIFVFGTAVMVSGVLVAKRVNEAFDLCG
ncbi:MAG TPA: hypothetical protein PLM92_03580 [Bacillota bacterium]|nr:hypothetical protein [Bacillota bacterium]HUM56061.1 hypothetical protein [Bacillota bacterium]